MSSDEFGGQVALVTGGARGIGRAVARRLASAGAAVCICDADGPAAELTVAELRSDGYELRAVQADVSRPEGAASAVDAAAVRHGGLDVLVNCAGISRYGTVPETDEDLWDEVIAVNLKAVFLVSRLAIPQLRRRGGGTIVNVSSTQAFAAQRRAAAYVASKGGVNALTRAMAVDHANENIRVNAVCPGSVDTPMLRAAADLHRPEAPEELLAEWGRTHPLGRVAAPEEVAEAVAFLASRRASFITGAALTVDGGLLAALGVELPQREDPA